VFIRFIDTKILGTSSRYEYYIITSSGGFVKLSIVIPTFNERHTIREIVNRVRATPFDKEILIVDDCSFDGTQDILKEMEKEPDIRIFYHRENRGKGASLRTGFGQVTGDVIIIQDADMEYDPSDYGILLEPILSGKADVVYGSRFLGGPHRVLYFWHSVANRMLTLFSNMMTNLNLTDMETCYKVFRADIIRNLRLSSNRFGFEPEITAKISRLGAKIYEVPISYNGRSYSEGKKIGWKDALSAFYFILKFRLIS
jgi:glycosyltransferase involved in cell wall biosynthesis